jgi:hypothetical protein
MSRTVYGFALAALAVLAWFSGSQTSSVGCINDTCRVSAESSFLGVAVAAVLLIFVTLGLQLKHQKDHFRKVRIVDRFFAFIIDLHIFLWIAVSINASHYILSEYFHTGNFNWNIERDFLRNSEAIAGFALTIATVAGWFGYFYSHAILGRPTPGQYVMGYRVEGLAGSERQPNYAMNIILGVIGLCVWPISLGMALAREDKAFWWNRVAATRLVALTKIRQAP